MKNTKLTKKNQDRLLNFSNDIALSEQQDISYMVKLFGFPYKKTKEKMILHKDGGLIFELASRKGLPYGTTPRIILSWLIKEAKVKNSRKINLGNNLRKFLKEIDIDTNGRNYKKVREQFQALLDTNFVISKETESSRYAIKFFISDKDSLWWNQDEKQGNLFNSEVIINENFFKLCKKAFPVSKLAMRSLKDSPLAMDLFFWLSIRIFNLKYPIIIKWSDLKIQFGFNYKNNKDGIKNFKNKFKSALEKISMLYPELNTEIVSDGLQIRPSKTFIKRIK